MARLVVMSDIHYTRHPPECRTETYGIEVLDKLHEVARIANAMKADTIACAGDWFHRKGRVTFRETNDLLSVLMGWRRLGLTCCGILGNHDIAGHSLDSLDNRAAGALVHSGALDLLDHGTLWLDGVAITGASYFHGCDSTDEGRVRAYGAPRPEGAAVHVHLAHGALMHSGSFFEAHTLAPDLIELLHQEGALPDVIVCGHLHYREGIKHYPRPGTRDERVTVARVGSVARVARDDIGRTPSVVLIATKGATWAAKEIPIKVKPIGVIAPKIDRGKLNNEHQERVMEFVRILRHEADQFSVSDHATLLERVAREAGFGRDVIDMALRAVEARQ